jgi:hypothetical protein
MYWLAEPVVLIAGVLQFVKESNTLFEIKFIKN